VDNANCPPEAGSINSPSDRIAGIPGHGAEAQLGAMVIAWLRIPQSEQWPDPGIGMLSAAMSSCFIGTAIAVTA